MGRPRNFDDDVVIERAMDAFWTHGYANTSPAQLSEATGIAKGSLYNAFSSKRELFARALVRYDQQSSAIAADLLARPGSTIECIRFALRSIVDFDLSQPLRRGCLVANTAVELAGHDPEIARTVRRMQDRPIGALTARIEQGRRDGDVDDDVHARAVAEFLANTLAGLRVMAITYDAPTLYRIIDSAVAVLRRPPSLRADPADPPPPADRAG
ncbi:TetR/AcrR family transcriptional repressor of nem operon [Nakamurella sp. UYEF19]|uniref:TetR/AcrR family transcriptional regulator n=1 Tax=Nakamurella sp. UYEF19 TaxID=1756392 RepID=UPI003397CD9C